MSNHKPHPNVQLSNRDVWKCFHFLFPSAGYSIENLLLRSISLRTVIIRFKSSILLPEDVPSNPCSPSPCGPNSHCQEVNGVAVCKCVEGFLGNPPTCRPECIVSSDCELTKACVNQKCRDPCPGSCALRAECSVVNHNPICRCPPSMTGDPFTSCTVIGETLKRIERFKIQGVLIFAMQPKYIIYFQFNCSNFASCGACFETLCRLYTR